MLKLRRATQVASLLFFIFLLILAARPGAVLVRVVDLYPRMSPLLFAATWINAWKFPIAFIPAIAAVAATIVFGRFFCGWVCPLGVTFDATDKWLGPRRRRNDSTEPLKWKPVKYFVLTITIISAYFEANLAGWLDPLSFATKLYSLVLLPGAEFASGLVLRGLGPIPVLGRVADNVYSMLKTSMYAPEQPHFHGMTAIFLIYLFVALLVYFNRRFWCRFLCPAGAVFALLSRFSLVRRRVDAEKCTSCGKCVRNCRMGAIAPGGLDGHRGECIECFTCKAVCPVKAISFPVAGAGSDKIPVDFGRRGFIASAAGALVAVPLVRVAPGKPGGNLVRPPGVPSEDFMMQACLRCGECMRACPTNGLQPVWLESGLEGLWTPKLSARNGYCEYSCSKCGQVCPSNAILEQTLEKKQKTVMGRAVFDKNRCIPWSRGQDCAVCEEHCPMPDKAIRLRPVDFLADDGKTVTVYQPYVVEDICIGCGTCEFVCPVEGEAGVRVTGTQQAVLKITKVPKGVAPVAPPIGQAAIPATAIPVPAVATATIPAGATQTELPVKEVTAPPLPGERAPVQLNPLVPAQFESWKSDGKMKLAVPSTLYDLIDGGAEVYLEYGFVKALRMGYTRGEDEILSVDVYYMKDTVASYGIFTNERGPSEVNLHIGDDSAGNDYEVKFRQEKYYVKISGDATREEMLRFAKIVSSGIGANGGKVAEESWRVAGFPRAKDKSEIIIRGPLAMKRIYDFPGKDIFGFASGGVGLCYRSDSAGDAALVRLRPGTKTNPAGVVASIKAGVAEKGLKQISASSSVKVPDGYTIHEGGGNTVAFRASGGFVDIITASEE